MKTNNIEPIEYDRIIFKEIKLPFGIRIDNAYDIMQNNAPCKAEFNGEMMYSTDSLDSMYLKATGYSRGYFYDRFNATMRKYSEERHKFEGIVTGLIEKYRAQARGIIPIDKLPFWVQFVTTRVTDIYRGMELGCILDIANILNKTDIDKRERFKQCRILFDEQEHSGCSGALTLSGLAAVHPLGQELSDFINSDYVDFGLPSGLLWAKKNLGAETEEDAGLYFQWEDMQGYTAEQVGVDKQFAYNFSDYKFIGESDFTKYNSTDGKTVLDSEDDAVHVMLGGNWRMPTNEDFHELINNTDLYLVPESGTEIHGVVNPYGTSSNTSIFFEWEQEPTGNIKGMKLYKKSDSSVYMFVPAVGIADNGSVQFVGEYGGLWSSSLYSKGVHGAWCFEFGKYIGGVYGNGRYDGLPFRGVF